MNGVHGAADVARKAKTPLIASGAAVAGVAGAVVLSQTGNGRRKVLGVSMPKRSKLGQAKRHMPGKRQMPKVHMPEIKGKDLRKDAHKLAGAVTDAAKQADALGQRVSQVANSVQKVGETAGEAAKKA